MTTEQPPRPARPPRPGREFRRAALGLPSDPGGRDARREGAGPAAGGAVAATTAVAPGRESLREALARIPDLDRDSPAAAIEALGGSARGSEEPKLRADHPGAGRPTPEVDGAPAVPEPTPAGEPEAKATPAVEGGSLRATVSRLLNGEVPADAEVTTMAEANGIAVVEISADPSQSDPSPTGATDSSPTSSPVDPVSGAGAGLSADAPEWLVAAAAEEEGAAARVASRQRRRPPTWRRVSFAAVVLVLIGAIPVLGRIGYQLVSESTDGRFTSSVKSPTDPGYETEVVSTPTMIFLQNDSDGRPVAATFLALSGAEGGGSVIFVPLETAVRTPAYGVDRIIRAFDVLADRPADGRKQVAVQVASLLNVGADTVAEVDDRGWAQLVEPVAPLTINNPDPLVTADGFEFPSGLLELEAEQVGPYLAATREGESAFNALMRHELVWEAWLDAIARSDRDDVVPGESSSGIGLFARELAAGPVTFSIVPTRPDPDHSSRLQPDTNLLGPMVLAAVPNPDPAQPRSRATVRLLNGVSSDTIPAGIIQSVVQVGGSVQVIGNGPSFGRDETTIIFADPFWEGHAKLLQTALGGGTIHHDTEAQDSVAITVILGRDVIDGAAQTTTTVDLSTDSGRGTGFSSGDVIDDGDDLLPGASGADPDESDPDDSDSEVPR